MRIRHEYDYVIIEGDEDILQRSSIKSSGMSRNATDYVPTGIQLYYLYDKARKTKTKDDANVYVLYRQMFLNKYGKKTKGAIT